MANGIWASVVWAACVLTTPAVEVRSERVHLADIVPTMPEPWASVDLGAAPQPLHRRILTSTDIYQIVGRARLARPPMALPGRVEVFRPGVSISEPELRKMVVDALVPQLPSGTTLRSLSVSGGIALGAGAVMVDFDQVRLRSGHQTVMATVRSGDGTSVVVPALVDINRGTRLEKPLIERGQEIMIVLTQGSIRVQSTGTAQQTGNIGDVITVTPSAGTRVLHARVIDARTVEVQG